MSEKKFDELFHDTNYVEVNQKIYRQMNKKIYSKVIKGFVVICLIVTTIFFGTSQLLNVVYYNPNHEEKFLKDDNANEFEVLFSTYYQMLHPGIIYVPEMNRKDTTIKSLGFGRYEVFGSFCKSFDSYIISPDTTALNLSKDFRLEISKSRAYIHGYNIAYQTEEFIEPKNDSLTGVYDFDAMKKEIQSLPKSAYLDISLSFENYVNLDVISEIIQKYPNTVRWVALKDQEIIDIFSIAGGLSLEGFRCWTLNAEANKKYPWFDLPMDQKDIDGDILKLSYLSRLKLLIDHPDFVKVMPEYNSDASLQRLKENYEKAQKELLSYGIRVYIDKKDILKLIEEYDVSYININDVKLSRFQK